MNPSPPANNELELSLFGPGVGECLVVHLGNGDWMVVDSCRNKSTGNPIALDYLTEIGVDVARQVKVVLVTHWHDDHIKGVADLFKAAASATFVYPEALSSDQFLRLVASGTNRHFIQQESGVSEFGAVLSELSRRRKEGLAGRNHIRAKSNTCVYRNNSASFPIEVHALSPSEKSCELALAAFAKSLPEVGESIGKVRPPNPNEVSIVLLVVTPIVSYLLGGDLERAFDNERGWLAILDSEVRPKSRSDVFKVSHHGSTNGDDARIWTELLVETPYALITPYGRGSKPLPSAEDVERVKRRTDHAYCTQWPISSKRVRRDTAVEKGIRETALNWRTSQRTPGQIRLRHSATLTIAQISLGGGARKL